MRTLDAPGRRTGYDKGLATERRITCWASRRTTPASPDKPRYGRQAVAFDFGVGLAHRAARTAAYGPCEAVAPAGRDTDRQRYGAGLSSKSTAPNVAGRARQVAQEPAAAPGCPRPRGVGSRPGAGGSWDCGEARSLPASVCQLASAGTAPASGMEARRGETRRLLGEARFTTARPDANQDAQAKTLRWLRSEQAEKRLRQMLSR